MDLRGTANFNSTTSNNSLPLLQGSSSCLEGEFESVNLIPADACLKSTDVQQVYAQSGLSLVFSLTLDVDKCPISSVMSMEVSVAILLVGLLIAIIL